MKPKRPLVIDLLGDTSDEEDNVTIFETSKKKARPTEYATTQTNSEYASLSTNSDNPLMNLPVSELKHRLAMRGISSHGCIEKKDLVQRLEENRDEDESGDSKAPAAAAATSVSRDAYGPLADGETTTVGDKDYTIKRTGQVYYCTCPSWKWQKMAPGQGRTCKHINELRSGYVPTNTVGVGATAKKPSSNKSTTTTNDNKIVVTLADTYKANKHDPTGYYISEKLDGMRCVWDGENTLWSRNGNAISAPQWFLDALPSHICLDGELFLGRERFQELMSLRGNANDARWNETRLVVFDAPKVQGEFPTRLDAIQNALRNVPTNIAYALEQTVCRGKAHVNEELERIIVLKGEGVMLRNPTAPYEHGRTKNLLKVKRWHDAEARVVGYTAGKGRNAGRLGSLECVMIPSGTPFSLGTGFKDAERESHLYPIGSIVTYSYQNLTDGGIPRFPKYLRARNEE